MKQEIKMIKIGDKFGRLTVVKQLENDRKGSKSRGRKFLCLCDCGKYKETYNNDLVKKTCRSCGCLDIESHTTGYGDITGSFWCDLTSSAKNRNIKLEIDIIFLDTLLKEQKYKCKISGLPIKIAPRRKKHETTASVDRIDSSKGYIKDNVQFVHKHVNIMKNCHTTEYFLSLCKEIVINNKL